LQDEDALEDLQDPDFLTALVRIRKREGLEEQAEEEEPEEEQPQVKKRRKEKPVLLKDIARDLVIPPSPPSTSTHVSSIAYDCQACLPHMV
jgi:hypothetical protein